MLKFRIMWRQGLALRALLMRPYIGRFFFRNTLRAIQLSVLFHILTNAIYKIKRPLKKLFDHYVMNIIYHSEIEINKWLITIFWKRISINAINVSRFIIYDYHINKQLNWIKYYSKHDFINKNDHV